jgi:hypothetical protein
MSKDENDITKEIVDAALKEAKPKQADVLIEIARRGTLFRNRDGIAFADIAVRGHRETWPVRSTGFRLWLGYCFYKENDRSAPNAEAMQTAITAIEAAATFEGKEYPVAVRVGGNLSRSVQR